MAAQLLKRLASKLANVADLLSPKLIFSAPSQFGAAKTKFTLTLGEAVISS